MNGIIQIFSSFFIIMLPLSPIFPKTCFTLSAWSFLILIVLCSWWKWLRILLFTSGPSILWRFANSPRRAPLLLPSPVKPACLSSKCSHRYFFLRPLRNTANFVSDSLYGLWPIVMLSHVAPMLWIDEAWFTERHTAASQEVKADNLPSGLPQARRQPRTTRWVIRWTRWSAGLAE